MVLVTVGQDDPIHPICVFPQEGQIGKDEIHARHVRLGKHDPDVENEQPTFYFDACAISANFPETAKENNPDGVRRLSHAKATQATLMLQRRVLGLEGPWGADTDQRAAQGPAESPSKVLGWASVPILRIDRMQAACD